MHQYKLGILGGMGPKATSMFFENLIDQTTASTDQEHIDSIILNHATIPDRTEAILNQNKQPFLSAVQQDFKIFEHAGVSHIAIPCNTSHYFFEEMQDMTTIPIINMVQETVKYIHQMDKIRGKVAILATDGTINSKVYENECVKLGIPTFLPDQTLQKQIMNIIYHVKADVHYRGDELNQLIRNLITLEGCSTIILGCTELSCITLASDIKEYCVDPMNVLVQESIRRTQEKGSVLAK